MNCCSTEPAPTQEDCHGHIRNIWKYLDCFITQFTAQKRNIFQFKVMFLPPNVKSFMENKLAEMIINIIGCSECNMKDINEGLKEDDDPEFQL